MVDDFWILPGPRRFVSGVAESAIDGCCVVVRAARPLMAELSSEVCRHLRAREHRHDVVEGPQSPLEAIAGFLPPQDEPWQMSSLMAELRKGARVFVATADSRDNYEAWREFITEFQRRISQLEQYQRPTIILVSNCAENASADDVALVNRSWASAWSEADALALAQSTLRAPPREELLKAVLVHTVARIALWDSELFAILGGLPADAILCPNPELQRFAQRRGWTTAAPPTPDEGTIGYVDGREFVHSAMLALPGQVSPGCISSSNELNRRRWHAQAAVLLPWIEEMRMQLVEDGARFLADRPDDPRAIREIGPVWYDLTRSNAPYGLKKRATLLRDTRNTLAHLRLLSASGIRTLSIEFS